MRKEQGLLFRKWLLILRAYSWPASIIPVILGSVVAWRGGGFSWADFGLTLPAALLIHSAANLANTYFDFKNGVDRKETADALAALVPNVIVTHPLAPPSVFVPEVLTITL